MSLSAQQTTAKLSFFHKLVAEWETKNANTSGFAEEGDVVGGERDGKDVVVAFRTRPPLDQEFERFEREKAEVEVPSGSEEGATAGGGQSKEEGSLKDTYRSGISVVSAQPGVMVAHVPGMKVCLDRSS